RRRADIYAIAPARQPFDPAWPTHNLGRMDVSCRHCGAMHWMDERLTSSTNANPQFGKCCLSGKVSLARLHNPPNELDSLLRGDDPESKSFRDNIRRYNNALAMTSLGCTVDHSVNQGQGPYIFKVQGRLSHLSGSLLPEPDVDPVYAQLYIYDPADALQARLANPINRDLSRGTMQKLQDMLFRLHPGAEMYKNAL
ncbi:hypothetical protein CPB83DRAFT_745206, partial [Crepidotus variabilis]